MATAVEELKPFGLSEANAINMSADEYAKQAAAYRKALQQRLIEQGLEEQLLNARVIIERNVGVVNFLNSILDKFNFNDEEDKPTEIK